METPTNPAVANLLPVMNDPNVRNFLDMISAAEGTTKHGYNTLFGGGKFDDLKDHPRILFDFTETTGKPNKTSAAGRYQFLSNTWDEQAKKLGLPDFSPQSQDLATINLLRERGILPDVLKGDWQTAVKKAGPIWASLPSSPYPQPRQSQDFVMGMLNNPKNLMASAPATSDANPIMPNQAENPFAALNEEFRIGAKPPVQTNENNPFAELNAEFQLKPVAAQQVAQAPQDTQKSWGDVAYGAVTNLPSSAAKYGKELVQAITSPIDTAKAVAQVAGGAVINQLPKGAQDWLLSVANDPEKMQQSVQMAQQVGGEYAKKYGSVEGLKNAIATDPVSVIGDLSILMTGGGALTAKVPGLATTGKAVSQVGRMIDPLNLATKAVTKPAQLAGLLASEGIGFTTGAGGGAIRESAKSGYQGGKAAESFLEQLRSNAPVENVVNSAKNALTEMRNQRANAYVTGMVDIGSDKTILNFNNIDNVLQNKKNVGTYKGQVIQPSTVETWQEITKVVDDWKKLDPAEFHTPEGLDRLKVRIGDIRDNAPFGTPARNVADAAYNAIKNEITTQAPNYAKVMKDYELASQTLKDIEGSLSLGKKANIDTSVRKLQSIFRNNANTNYGRRVEQAEMLKNAGAETLMPELAGQALSSWTPRSLQGVGSALTAAGSAAANPLYAAGLPLASPRFVGESAYYAGKLAGTPKRLADALKQTSAGGKASNATSQLIEALQTRGGAALDPYVLRMLATKLGQQQPEEQR